MICSLALFFWLGTHSLSPSAQAVTLDSAFQAMLQKVHGKSELPIQSGRLAFVTDSNGQGVYLEQQNGQSKLLISGEPVLVPNSSGLDISNQPSPNSKYAWGLSVKWEPRRNLATYSPMNDQGVIVGVKRQGRLHFYHIKQEGDAHKVTDVDANAYPIEKADLYLYKTRDGYFWGLTLQQPNRFTHALPEGETHLIEEASGQSLRAYKQPQLPILKDEGQQEYFVWERPVAPAYYSNGVAANQALAATEELEVKRISTFRFSDNINKDDRTFFREALWRHELEAAQRDRHIQELLKKRETQEPVNNDVYGEMISLGSDPSSAIDYLIVKARAHRDKIKMWPLTQEQENWLEPEEKRRLQDKGLIQLESDSRFPCSVLLWRDKT